MTNQEIIDKQKATIAMLKNRIAHFEMLIEKRPWKKMKYSTDDWRPLEIEDCRNKMEDARRIIIALEKQIPKKPIETDFDYECPVCGWEYMTDENYCPHCGQKFDWSV